ncbi:MAG: hypothetical protein MHMPM18_002068, partial [Marteilia pararefringens]
YDQSSNDSSGSDAAVSTTPIDDSVIQNSTFSAPKDEWIDPRYSNPSFSTFTQIQSGIPLSAQKDEWIDPRFTTPSFTSFTSIKDAQSLQYPELEGKTRF